MLVRKSAGRGVFRYDYDFVEDILLYFFWVWIYFVFGKE